MVIEVTPGEQEVQISCEGRRSALHRFEVDAARDVIVRLSADAALVQHEGISWLRYEGGRAAVQGAEDASVLASEAGADSFVLMRAEGRQISVEWVRLPTSLEGVNKVPLVAAPAQRAALVKAVFHNDAVSVGADAKPQKPERSSRVFADYALGGGLLAASAAVSVYPLMAIVRDGQCTDSQCNTLYRGRSVGGFAMLAGSGLLAASGVAIVWVGPFGRRASVSVANGIAVKGAF